VRFLIDENVNVSVCDPLRILFPDHEFTTVVEQGFVGLLDVDLFEAMSVAGFGALVTHDRRQLQADSSERQALRDRGLHWIGIKPSGRPGIVGAALETAALVAGLPYVLADLDQSTVPTAFHLRNVPFEHDQRVKAEPL
jgi:hypothetical protein